MEKLTKNEKGIIAFMRFKNEFDKGKRETVKTLNWGRLSITYTQRSRKLLWGRFGGGWQWKLGFMAAGKTVIVNLLVCSIRFHIREE